MKNTQYERPLILSIVCWWILAGALLAALISGLCWAVLYARGAQKPMLLTHAYMVVQNTAVFVAAVMMLRRNHRGRLLAILLIPLTGISYLLLSDMVGMMRPFGLLAGCAFILVLLTPSTSRYFAAGKEGLDGSETNFSVRDKADFREIATPAGRTIINAAMNAMALLLIGCTLWSITLKVKESAFLMILTEILAPEHLSPDRLLKNLKSPNDELVSETLNFLKRRGDPLASNTAVLLLSSPNTAVQTDAALYLGSLNDRRAVPYLIELLPDTTLPMRRGELVRSLQNITGENFGDDIEQWRAWQKGQTTDSREK